MVKSLVDNEVTSESTASGVSNSKPKPPGTKGKATSADQINGWSNNEIVIGETEAFLEEVLENIRGGRRVNLRGSRVTSIDRFNPTK